MTRSKSSPVGTNLFENFSQCLGVALFVRRLIGQVLSYLFVTYGAPLVYKEPCVVASRGHTMRKNEIRYSFTAHAKAAGVANAKKLLARLKALGTVLWLCLRPLLAAVSAASTAFLATAPVLALCASPPARASSAASSSNYIKPHAAAGVKRSRANFARTTRTKSFLSKGKEIAAHREKSRLMPGQQPRFIEQRSPKGQNVKTSGLELHDLGPLDRGSHSADQIDLFDTTCLRREQ